MKSIRRIKVKQEFDDFPDFSWLGRYSNKWEPGAIDRSRFSKHYSYGQFPWFISENHWPHNPENWKHVHGAELASVIKKYRTLKRADWCYALQDMERLDTLGETWEIIGIYAEARIVVDGVCQTIRSGGLWGIESDSGQDYLDDVATEEVHMLFEILRELGFSKEEIEAVEVEG